MSLVTNDTPGQPRALKFPRLMQNKHSGAVYLVTQGVGPDVDCFAATCIHHGTVVPRHAMPGQPQFPVTPDPVGKHIADSTLHNLQDYPNPVYIQNEG